MSFKLRMRRQDKPAIEQPAQSHEDTADRSRDLKRHISLAVLILGMASLGIAGCRLEGPPASEEPNPRSLGSLPLGEFSVWSTPVNIGDPVNTAANERNPFLTRDELTLYFSSNRAGGMGGFDIWVSRRLTKHDPWGEPENLKAINTSANDSAPSISLDGHLLFFASTREGPTNDSDIYVARRLILSNDDGWGWIKKLEGGVNTDDQEQAPFFLQSAEGGPVNLYFNRGDPLTDAADIYYAAVTRWGETLGRVKPVDELNVVGKADAAPSIRIDGREIFFWSSREDGDWDLFTATRNSIWHPWSGVHNVSELNTDAREFTPRLSFDARTLVFGAGAGRPGLGGDDLWIATRARTKDR